MPVSTKEKMSYWWVWVFAAMIPVFYLFSTGPYWLPQWLSLNTKTPNEFGDSFGFANAFFSSMAFAGVIVTLILQMKELKAQRDEMVEMQRVQLLSVALQCNTLEKEHDIESDDEFGDIDFVVRFVNSQVLDYARQNNSMEFHHVVLKIFSKLQSLHAFMLVKGVSDSTAAKVRKYLAGIQQFSANCADSPHYNTVQRNYFSTHSRLALALMLGLFQVEENKEKLLEIVTKDHDLHKDVTMLVGVKFGGDGLDAMVSSLKSLAEKAETLTPSQ